MAGLLTLARRMVLPSSQPRKFHRDGATVLPSDQLVEEETLPDYDVEVYYPVHIGEIYNDRYQVLGKLGYGVTSTVWFCRDLEQRQYVAIKVYIKTPKEDMNRELVAYQHLRKLRSLHPGQKYIRQIIDSFQLKRLDGSSHHCLVHPPLHRTLYDFQRLGGRSRPLPEIMVKGALHYLLLALDYLHSEAHITHCDIKLSNIMLTIKDLSILEDFEETERGSPCPYKPINDERNIYVSRHFRHPKSHAWGHPVLCDFGEARIGGPFDYEEIQPEVYKAPEIIMQNQWSHGVDIWNLACVVWDMIEDRHLFDARDEEGYHNNRFHMSEMIAYLGHPPAEFLRRSPNTWRIFNEDGSWKGHPAIPSISLESEARQLQGASKAAFVNFMRSMLTWLPEDRKTAGQLLGDPWLESS